VNTEGNTQVVFAAAGASHDGHRGVCRLVVSAQSIASRPKHPYGVVWLQFSTPKQSEKIKKKHMHQVTS